MKDKPEILRLSCWLLAALLFGGLLRLCYLGEFAASPLCAIPVGADIGEYDLWARGILSGALLWEEIPIHAPLYPFFLAGLYWLTNLDMVLVRGLQLFLNLDALFALALLFLWRARSSTAGVWERFIPWLFLLLAMFFPLPFYHQAELVSEALLLPLLCATLALLCLADEFPCGKSRVALLAGAGLCAGLALITHPLAAPFVAAELLLLCVCAWRERAAEGGKGMRAFLGPLLFFCAVGLAVLPVCLYNSHLAGRPVFVQANSGFNVYLGNNPDATGGCYVRPGPGWDSLHRKAEQEAARKGVSKDALFIWKTADFIFEHPFQWLGLLAKKALLVWNWREYPSGGDLSLLRWYAPIQKTFFWTWGVIAALALAGLALAIGRRDFLWRHRHMFLLLVTFWLAQTLTVTSARYRMAMLPAVLFFAACALGFLWEKRAEIKKFLLGIGLVAGGFLAVSLPGMRTDQAAENAEARSIFGEALLLAERPQEALPHLKRAAEGLPNWSRSFELLGLAHARLGNRLESLQMFEMALDIAPYEALSWMNIGVWLAQGKDDGGARKCFEKALSLEAHNPDSLFNLALLQLRHGEEAAAEKNLRACLRAAPSHRRALNTLGVLLLRRGEAAAALSLFERSSRLEPGNPRLLLNLAAATAASGDKSGAAQVLKKALRLDPELKEAKEFLKSLEQ